MPWQCGYPDGMSPRGRMVFQRPETEGKPSSRGELYIIIIIHIYKVSHMLYFCHFVYMIKFAAAFSFIVFELRKPVPKLAKVWE